jgi:hypothetical protein
MLRSVGFTCACKKELDVCEMLDATTKYDGALDIVFVKCPACAAQSEVRVSNGEIGVGYVYAAGAPHFAEMSRIDVPGLTAASEGSGLIVTLGERTWKVPA